MEKGARLVKWEVALSKTVRKQLHKLGRPAEVKISAYLTTRLAASDNPRLFGKPLVGSFAGLWRYRVGDYRLICEIRDHELLVLVLKVGHRRDIYQ